MSDTYNNNTEYFCDEHAIERDVCGCTFGGDPLKMHRGQTLMAYRLAATNADHLMHVHGIGWHVYDGTRWIEDLEGGAVQALTAELRTALDESLNKKELRDDVRKCESAAGINGVLDIASSLLAFTTDHLDPDPYLLNVANGTLDLRTMELRPHNPTDRITKICGAAWTPDTTGTAWETFLARSLPDTDVRGFLQRYVGVALCGKVLEHVLAILTGTGRNGKGVFYGAVAAALGDYATTAEPDLFMHRDGAHPTGEMDLMGARWVVISESDEGRKLAQATVKRLTGGDRIKARRMRQDFVAFDPSHTAALVTNHLPKVNGDDPALWARLRVVPFDVVIPKEERNPHLGDELALEADAILAWCVAGWTAYRAQGLAEPEAVLAATHAYEIDSDAIARFIQEACVTLPGVSARTNDLYAAYGKWQAQDGSELMALKPFAQALDTKGYEARKSDGVKVRKGIAVAAEDVPEAW